MKHEKPIYWVGTSYKDLLAFTDEAKREAGYQLHRVQNGLDPENWKPFETIDRLHFFDIVRGNLMS